MRIPKNARRIHHRLYEGGDMRSYFNTVLLFLLMMAGSTVHSQALTLDETMLRANDALTELKRWNNTHLRNLLMDRIQQNEFLISVLMDVDLLNEPTEIDAQFDYAVKNIINDQLGLSFFAKNIAMITRQEALDIDALLTEKKGLKQEYQESLSYSQGITSSKHLVNRLLYISLMEKYASI